MVLVFEKTRTPWVKVLDLDGGYDEGLNLIGQWFSAFSVCKETLSGAVLEIHPDTATPLQSGWWPCRSRTHLVCA